MTLSTVPVIFDLDGTLVDPAGGIQDGIAAALAAVGMPVPGPEVLQSMIGPKLSDALLNTVGVPADLLDETIRLYREYYRSTGIGQGRVYPGVRELLTELQAAGHTLAVATQKPEGLAHVVLEHHGLADFFTSIRGSSEDETLAGVHLGKKEIIGQALLDLGTAAAVMVGDRAQDVAGALANGIDCIGVRWGFAVDGELEAAGAAALVDQPAEVAAAVATLTAFAAVTVQEETNGAV
ncbi:HAD hydrolase-like protein [Pseudarthrobacter sp. J64]|uniref:HAD hydrolase-like protein n=1 Tax=Pseudarthrobacter sp. J64 TaxID=3116485 RepID=UPI002E80CBB7|nr:HAD hydrolase-like protein [Pseudarthrobacter sp. J64]MEE2569027.1 HAD hydrolase-like protein [Pseudarthrobacter sp. J64]